jgi:hypothetical protein
MSLGYDKFMARISLPEDGFFLGKRDSLYAMPFAFCPYLFHQVEYFLSPLDFLKHLLTFFLFRAAFKRLALPRFFMLASVFRSLNSH